MFSIWLSGDDWADRAVWATTDYPGTTALHILQLWISSHTPVFQPTYAKLTTHKYTMIDSNETEFSESLELIEEILWDVVITLHTKIVLQFIVPASLIG